MISWIVRISSFTKIVLQGKFASQDNTKVLFISAQWILSHVLH